MSEPTPQAIEAAARAIHRYDWEHQLSAGSAPNKHHRAEAEAALSAAAPYLIREAQAQALEEAAEALYQEGREVLKGEQSKQMPVRLWSASKREGYELGIITGRTVLHELRARAAAIRDGAE